MIGKNQNNIHIYATGIAASIGMLLLCNILLAYLLVNSIVGQGSAQITIPILQGISAAIGSVIATRKMKGKLLETAVITGCAFILLLTFGGLLMNGRFENIGGSVIAIFCGSIIPCVFRNKQRRKHRIIIHHNR